MLNIRKWLVLALGIGGVLLLGIVLMLAQKSEQPTVVNEEVAGAQEIKNSFGDPPPRVCPIGRIVLGKKFLTKRAGLRFLKDCAPSHL